jgi:hypothetical protein
MDHRFLVVPQGLYYMITGLWPLLHMRSFLAVTGPKTDLWLVNMVGLLAAAVGAALLTSAAETGPGRPVLVLALASATAFLAVDIVYVARRVIRKVYLSDAVVQLLLIAAWLAFLLGP